MPAIPALQAAFRMSGHIRQHLWHVLEGELEHGAQCTPSRPAKVARSVHPVSRYLALPVTPWWRTRRVKVARIRGQVHGD